MAKLTVRYNVIVYETIDWPDDEMDNLNYDNLLCNLDIENSSEHIVEEITDIQKNGVEFNFE
jgi:hypothetical protein